MNLKTIMEGQKVRYESNGMTITNTNYSAETWNIRTKNGNYCINAGLAYMLKNFPPPPNDVEFFWRVRRISEL